jgi:hypothetical protein
VTETMGRSRPVRKRSRLYNWLFGRGRRFLLFCSFLAGGLAAYVLGTELAYRDMTAAKRLTEQLQSEGQRLKKEIVEQNAGLVTLQAKLKSVQSALEDVMPSENTYKISPNQSLVVASGRLTIGLVGSPTNEAVNLNINGKQQPAATGDVINIALNPPCRVQVQSFDMFRAIVTASCAAGQPR